MILDVGFLSKESNPLLIRYALSLSEISLVDPNSYFKGFFGLSSSSLYISKSFCYVCISSIGL